MIILNARQMPLETIRDVRVNRDSEVETCLHYLNQRRENAFLWGVRGVGKTFLVRLIESELREETSILPVNVDVLGLPGFGRHDATTAFPEAVLLSICKSVWKEVLGKPYSELRARLDLREGNLRLPSKLARTIESIYLHLMASQRKAHYGYSNSVGFSAGAKGEKKETGWIEQEQPPILPFEFLEFCEELLAVLKDKGKTRVIALCDEANLLPYGQQINILSRYIDLFASRSIQFLFVAGFIAGESVPPPVPEGFDLVLNVKGLSPAAAAELMVRTASRAGLEIEPEGVKIAHTRLEGNPRLLLRALESAITIDDNAVKITSQMIGTVCDDILRRLRREKLYVESMRGSATQLKPKA